MNMRNTTMFCILLSLFTANFIQPEHKYSGTVVVTISGQEIMQKSKTGQSIAKKLEEEQGKLSKSLEKDQKTLQEKEKALKEKNENLNKKASEIEKNSLLNAEAKQEEYEKLQNKVREIEEGKAELDRLVKRLQTDIQRLERQMLQKQQEEMGKFDAKIKKLIKELAEKHGWDIVLMEESIVYSNKASSKTDLFIEALDKQEGLSSAKSDDKKIPGLTL